MSARPATLISHVCPVTAQHERLARAAAAQRRLVAYWTRFPKLQYEAALAAPPPARLATLITQLEKQAVSA
jgi:hypothetical protein